MSDETKDTKVTTAAPPGVRATSSETDPAMGDARDNDGPPIGAHNPASLPRAEEDDRVFARSPEFNDLPGSGKYLGGPSVRDMTGGASDEAAPPESANEGRPRPDSDSSE